MWEQLESFLSEPDTFPLNTFGQWTRFEDGEVYIRKFSKCVFEGDFVECMSLGNVNRPGRKLEFDATVKSSGFMGRLMDVIEQHAAINNRHVKIENVLNEFLPDWYEQRGYMEMGGIPRCYFRLTTNLAEKDKEVRHG